MKIILFLLVSLSLSTTFAKDTPLVTGDLGGSSGNNNGTTYQEVHLGVNLNFTDWLTWRNSGFQRTGSKTKTVSGLDSTLRLVLRTKFDQSGGAHLFIGPGYRWTNAEINNAIIGEAGLGVNFSGVGLSGGAKYLKYDKDRFDTDGNVLKNEDVNYFINISGNTSFGK